VTIESLSPNGFSWVVRDRHALVAGAGRFATVGRHVVAIAATAPVTGHAGTVGAGRGACEEPVACS
jgi:hypothetical protein